MIIHLIASPRNVSTALMYSMGQHSDIFPVDEPFYACYLKESGKDHPGREKILRSQPIDRGEVFDHLRELESRYPVVFVKNMAHHIREEDLLLMSDWKHCFLIRHPRLHIFSFTRVISHPDLDALGTTRQRKLYEILVSQGHVPYVIDSHHLLLDPQKELTELCHYLGIDFQKDMLHWPAGSKPFDGCWAPYWYRSVWDSTEFSEPREVDQVQLPGYLMPLFDACMVDYQYLSDQIKK